MALASEGQVACPCQDWPADARLLHARPLPLASATARQLAGIPGLGPVRSGAIVAERDRAAFASLADLARTRGIGPATVERLRRYLYAGSSDPACPDPDRRGARLSGHTEQTAHPGG